MFNSTFHFSPYIKFIGRIIYKHLKPLLQVPKFRKLLNHRFRLRFSNAHAPLSALLIGRNNHILKYENDFFRDKNLKLHCNCNKQNLKKPSMKDLHADGKCNAVGALYQYNCLECKFSYLGTSNQGAKVRFKKHLSSEDSAIYQHRISSGHEGRFNIKRIYPQSEIGGFSCSLCVGELLAIKKARYGVTRGRALGNRKEETTFCCPHRRKLDPLILADLNGICNMMKKP